ncbi:MAG: SusD/RagB family nutrient-binding outer membrane lipoprotein, partial [Alistipes sp.]
MKAIKYIITASVLLAAFSCRTLEEYNESPNQIPVGEVPPSALMDELICSGAINCQQRFYDTYAELMQYTCITSSSNEVISRYYIAPSYIENCWNNFARWSANADHMYDVAVKAEMKNYQAVALTLRAMYIDMLAPTFGPIPFTEAFQIRNGNNKPVFDNEKTIYTQLILDLEKANELYKESSNLEDTSKDKLYYGDIKKWQKF